MRRNLYIAAFILVLIVACGGGFLAARVFLTRARADFAPEPTAVITTNPNAVSTGIGGAGETATEAPTSSPAPRATATILVVPAPVTDQPPVLTAEPTWTPGVELPTPEAGFPSATPLGEISGTPEAGGSVTPEASATALEAYPYVLAHAVRYTSGDCPGTYALGTVTDRRGNPLPGVRLNLVDEYGHETTAVSKPGPGDTGHYDFPMGGPARRFYMTIVDEANHPLSQRVEILHEIAPYEGKGCRWVDWRKTQ